MRHPLVVQGHALLRNFLRLPGPVAVRVKIIVRVATTGPGFVVLAGKRCWIGHAALHLVVPVHITVVAVGVQTGVQNHDGIVQDFLGGAIFGI